MNHFAHLVLSQDTVESTVGNLLGDFARGVQIQHLPDKIRAGLENHREVDRFTDQHLLVIELKSCFSKHRRRFSGIALDIYFDHLLIRHWPRFEQRDLDQTIANFYTHMKAGETLMPGENMRRTTRRMVQYDWFGSYRELDSVAESMDRVAERIRFENQFHGAMEDILRHQGTIEQNFIEFFPQLKTHVASCAIESG
ncbi:MAG: ACP phosphodiesterase [Pseudomonadota bacterium]